MKQLVHATREQFQKLSQTILEIHFWRKKSNKVTTLSWNLRNRTRWSSKIWIVHVWEVRGRSITPESLEFTLSSAAISRVFTYVLSSDCLSISSIVIDGEMSTLLSLFASDVAAARDSMAIGGFLQRTVCSGVEALILSHKRVMQQWSEKSIDERQMPSNGDI